MALSKDRDTKRREGVLFNHPLAANVVIFAGALVALDASGNATPGATATTLTAVGVAQETVNNTGGSAGDKRVEVRRGVFQFANSGSTDAITRAEIGKSVYIVDDQTVAKTSGTSTRSVAGVVRDVDAGGVWIEI